MDVSGNKMISGGVWTPAMRNAWIEDALNSRAPRGHRGGKYSFHVMPKVGHDGNASSASDKNTLISVVGKALKDTIYGGWMGTKRPFKEVSLLIYPRLVENLKRDTGVNRMLYTGDVVAFIKGSTAYEYLSPDDAALPPSGDTDIAVYINPFLPTKTFDRLSSVVHRTVLQTISQYKRCLDHMFFVDQKGGGGVSNVGTIRDVFLDGARIQAFKEAFTSALNACDSSAMRLVSPFESVDVRNKASRQSFIIDNHRIDASLVSRVEIPHFEQCETIPLRRTPLVCSHNRTIVFDRCEGGDAHVVFGNMVDGTIPLNEQNKGVPSTAAAIVVGSFELFRIKLNVMMEEAHEAPHVVTDDGPVKDATPATPTTSKALSIEFIDISVPRRDDAELRDFFNTHTEDGNDVSPPAKTMFCWDGDVQYNMCVPTLETVIKDLFKMLYVYPCPPHKRAVREARYARLLELRAASASMPERAATP